MQKCTSIKSDDKNSSFVKQSYGANLQTLLKKMGDIFTEKFRETL